MGRKVYERCGLPSYYVKPTICCGRCQPRQKYEKEIGDKDTKWCPDCDNCDRIMSYEIRREIDRVFYLTERCIGYNGMSGVPEIVRLPSEILNEDAELMGIVDFMFGERIRRFVARQKKPGEEQSTAGDSEEVLEEIEAGKRRKPSWIIGDEGSDIGIPEKG